MCERWCICVWCVRAWMHLRDFCPSKRNNGCEGRAVALEISILGDEMWGAYIIQHWPNWRAGSCTQSSALQTCQNPQSSWKKAWAESMKCTKEAAASIQVWGSFEPLRCKKASALTRLLSLSLRTKKTPNTKLHFAFVLNGIWHNQHSFLGQMTVAIGNHRY